MTVYEKLSHRLTEKIFFLLVFSVISLQTYEIGISKTADNEQHLCHSKSMATTCNSVYTPK